MTLIIRDERGKPVTDKNPIIIEHNGTLGDEVTLPLMIENTSKDHFHRDISISVDPKPPVDSLLNLPTAPNPGYYGPRIGIKRINPLEKVTFFYKSIVKTDTPEQVVTGTILHITSLEFPLS